MAVSKKVTQLPAATSIVATDLVLVVDDPSGSAVTLKATWTKVRDYILGISSGTATITESVVVSGTLTVSQAAAINAALTVTKTTAQLNLRYDANEYLTVTVGATGTATISLTGTDRKLVVPGSSQFHSTDTWLYCGASAAGQASLRVPHGTAPSSPTNGDIWTTSSGMFVRINGVTKSVNLT